MTCLYAAASMWPQSLSAAAQSVVSKPRLAPLLLFAFLVLRLAVFLRAMLTPDDVLPSSTRLRPVPGGRHEWADLEP